MNHADSPVSYEGPEAFRGVLEEAYQHVSSYLTREEKPHVIVGEIGRICTSNGSVVVEGDPPSNATIDRRYTLALTHANSADMEYFSDRLRFACDDANMLEAGAVLEYDPKIDALLFDPKGFMGYYIANSYSAESVLASRDARLIGGHLKLLDFPQEIVFGLFNWDIGDTAIQKAVRECYAALQPDFHKLRDGKSLSRKTMLPEYYEAALAHGPPAAQDNLSRIRLYYDNMKTPP